MQEGYSKILVGWNGLKSSSTIARGFHLQWIKSSRTIIRGLHLHWTKSGSTMIRGLHLQWILHLWVITCSKPTKKAVAQPLDTVLVFILLTLNTSWPCPQGNGRVNMKCRMSLEKHELWKFRENHKTFQV